MDRNRKERKQERKRERERERDGVGSRYYKKLVGECLKGGSEGGEI